MARRVPYGWPGSQIYIHYHLENAKAAAGSFGTTIADIKENALSQIRGLTTTRFQQSVYGGITPTKLKGFANEIRDLDQAVSDTQQVTDFLTNILVGTVEDATGSSSSNYAATVSNKVATLIGGIGSNYKNLKKVTQQVTELLDLYYNTDLESLIKIKQNTPTKIAQAQYESLLQLQQYLTGQSTLSLKDIRNLLVDIFTEQGLPDFLQRCATLANEQYKTLIDSAVHLGSSTIEGSQAKGKIDVNITFNLPQGGSTRKVTQGISVKSNYFGLQANILSTTLAKSLTYSGLSNLEPQANAISLMKEDVLHRWFIWANLDRAIQGTSNAIVSAYNLQDRADMIIEFTAEGMQIYNINDILCRLVKKLKDLGNRSLGSLGYGVRQQYNKLYAYDRSKFRENTPETIEQRADYSNRWLTGTHTIVLDVHRLETALRS